MAYLFCENCRKETAFLPIYLTTKVAGVSRSTVYYWMSRGWIHWRELASGRRVICSDSLTRRPPIPSATIFRPTVSNAVQPRRLTPARNG
jgi:hypothetical protein